MSIWILSIVVVLSTVGLGWRQGIIRAVFAFLGIVVAALLAVPIGHLLRPLLAHVGFPNETMAWMVAPVAAFLVVMTLFKAAGHYLHRESEIYHKHRVSDLELNIWTRLNHRLGACMGVLNGTAYLVLLYFIIFNIGFWTDQVAASDTEPATTRLLNRLAEDMQSTGLAKVAPAVGTMPGDYYNLANLAGLLCQNPDLTARLARYPMFLSLLERDEIKQITSDTSLTNDWTTHVSMNQMLNEPVIQGLLKNNDLINSVWSIVEPNLDDLNTYLQTGKSPKYDAQVIFGHWDFNVRITFAYTRLNMPANMSSSEMRAARAWMADAYAQTMLIVAGDNQAYLKYWPDTKTKRQPDQPMPTINWKGSWTQEGTNYQFTLASDADNKTYSGSTDGQRLMLKDDKNTFVFDHEE